MYSTLFGGINLGAFALVLSNDTMRWSVEQSRLSMEDSSARGQSLHRGVIRHRLALQYARHDVDYGDGVNRLLWHVLKAWRHSH